MNKFNIGDSVTVTIGPFKSIYGIIVMYDKKSQKYLVRFNGDQQLFFLESEIAIWGK